MRFDVHNWRDLKQAVAEMDKPEHKKEPKVLVFITPGAVFHRFVISEHGLEKMDCDATGRPLDI
jgi:hypothetical protein